MKYAIVFTFLFLYFNLSAQRPIPVDSIFTFIKDRSIHSQKADWSKIQSGLIKKLQQSKNQVDTIKALTYIFEAIGDYHSQINFNGRQFANYPDFDEATLNYLTPLVTRSNEETGRIKSQLLSTNIGYIQIPTIMSRGEQVNEFAQTISDSICSLNQQQAKAFIIDLRLNGGGQISSMIAGLNMLLGDGYVGGGVDISEKESQKFEVKNGNFFINGNAMTNISNHCNAKLSKKPVVILIGPVTRSSGSITALAFKGRQNTYFIGEATADGYTTGNDYFYFRPNLDLNLSVSNSIDRNKKVYKNSATPDIVIKDGDNFGDLEQDAKVKAAVEWLKKR